MGWRVTIIGLGLIGGSLGLALRDSGRVELVSGFDQDPAVVRQALEMGAVDRADELGEVVREADFVFYCVPLASMPGLVKATAPWLAPGCIVTDVGSVKVPVGRWLSELPPQVHAIGGHPMAGSERTGIGSADRYLFENAIYVLTPFNQVPAESVDRLARLIEETGARVRIMDAHAHDRAVAQISHLPHVLAYSLLGLVEDSQEGKLLAAGSFRDLTRVAAASSQLWEDILYSNRLEVIEAIDAMIEKLKEFRHDLGQGDRGSLGRRICSAQQVRQSIPQLKRGLLPEAHEIIAMVPDRPGMIGQLGRWLGDRGINIVDLEILRVREGDGGTIRLGVPTADAAQAAVETLNEQGIRAWRR